MKRQAHMNVLFCFPGGWRHHWTEERRSGEDNDHCYYSCMCRSSGAVAQRISPISASTGQGKFVYNRSSGCGVVGICGSTTPPTLFLSTLAPSFPTLAPSFLTLAPSFLTLAPSFPTLAPSFPTLAPSFQPSLLIPNPRSLIPNPRSLIPTLTPSFPTLAPSFPTLAPSHSQPSLLIPNPRSSFLKLLIPNPRSSFPTLAPSFPTLAPSFPTLPLPHSQPSLPHSQPSLPHSQPSSLIPNPRSLISQPRSSFPTLAPSFPNPRLPHLPSQPSLPHSQPSLRIPNPRSRIPNPRSAFPAPRSRIPNPSLHIPNPRSAFPTLAPSFPTLAPHSQPSLLIPNPRSLIPNPRSSFPTRSLIPNPRSSFPTLAPSFPTLAPHSTTLAPSFPNLPRSLKPSLRIPNLRSLVPNPRSIPNPRSPHSQPCPHSQPSLPHSQPSLPHSQPSLPHFPTLAPLIPNPPPLIPNPRSSFPTLLPHSQPSLPHSQPSLPHSQPSLLIPNPPPHSNPRSLIPNPRSLIPTLAPFSPHSLFIPPGAGKTYLVKQMSNVCEMPLYGVHTNQVRGAPAVRKLFEQARDNYPSLVFMDDVDAIFSNHDDDPACSTLIQNIRDELFTQLGPRKLKIIDPKSTKNPTDSTVSNSAGGVGWVHRESCLQPKFYIGQATSAPPDEDEDVFDEEDSPYPDNNGIIVVAATSTPWLLYKDHELLSRFRGVYLVGLPDKQTRYNLLKSLFQDVHHSLTDKDIMVALSWLLHQWGSPGGEGVAVKLKQLGRFTPADLMVVVKTLTYRQFSFLLSMALHPGSAGSSSDVGSTGSQTPLSSRKYLRRHLSLILMDFRSQRVT
ncbi:Zonadhesin-like 3 [Homarus americanus]|uniref:Zonadhesin-like 3 n=1 Tax=Homarus americanus TaxID=6706 RepID=A0A8J5JMQ4_HOMAM|nr:Zonadhesin-like 3 [Homarus americanus]